MSNLPTGTVTFLFTDIEGSTKRWELYPQQMRSALSRHDTLLREAIESSGGYIFKTMGDAFCAAFASPHDALGAALSLQRSLANEEWPIEIGGMRVRAALHTGVVDEQGGDYFGQPVNRVARLLSTGHGGQTLLSDSTYELVRDNLPTVQLSDLGEHRLKDLIRPEHVYQVVAVGLPAMFPLLKTLDNRPNNLPVQPTLLVGRENEVAEVVALLRREGARLVTLAGTGGTGKTRLSLQVAAEMLDQLSDGVWFVELSALTDHNLVLPTIAGVLGVKETSGQPLIETLKGYLKEKEVLLVLDNFEQVVDAALHITQLLAACPKLKILVTSRVPLRLRGEKEYPVPPLLLPDHRPGHLPPLERLTQYDSVRLFIERASDIKTDFKVTNESAPAVAEICVRVDGLPLAIELAAARVRLFTPEALLSRLSSRLNVLTGGARDLPARQQTLRGAIDWSYDLLDDGEKQLFRRLAVFIGGSTPEAIEAVCNADRDLQIDVLEGVESLVTKSLLRQDAGSNGEPRFMMLETIHEYAREKVEEIGETEGLRREHALYFMKLCEEADIQFRGANLPEWLDKIQSEQDNIRALLQWALEAENGDLETGMRTAGSLSRFWGKRGNWQEGRNWLTRLLMSDSGMSSDMQFSAISSMQQSRTIGRAKALGAAASFQGERELALSLATDALTLARELDFKQGIADGLHGLGYYLHIAGNLEECLPFYRESLDISRQLHDYQGMTNNLARLGDVAAEREDYVSAKALYEEALSLNRRVGNKSGISACLSGLGEMARLQGDHESAEGYYEQALGIGREIRSRNTILDLVGNLGHVRLHRGDVQAAYDLFSEGLRLAEQQGAWDYVDNYFIGMAGVQAYRQQPRTAATLFGVVDQLKEAAGIPIQPADRQEYEHYLAVASVQLDPNTWNTLWMEGRAMSMEQALAYALEDTTRG
jgi:predicted ATPase/class 3 adenylate cyclase